MGYHCKEWTSHMPKTTGPCTFPGCGRPISRRNLCQTHRMQEGRGQPLRPIAELTPRAGSCAFPDCGRPIKSKGLCQVHYRQHLTGATLVPVKTAKSPERPCSAPDCDDIAKVKGLCMSHYQQAWRGAPFTRIVRFESIEQRFWAKVQEGQPPAHAPEMGPCWLWTSAIQASGHATFGLARGRNVRAYRWAYEYMVALIPNGLTLDHLCRTPACVNPYHLDPVPLAVNIARIPTTTHCPAGHEYTSGNTYLPPSGAGKKCRECGRIRCRAYNARRANQTRT